MKISEEDNKKMLKSIEGKRTFKHCLACERMFNKGTVCPWCGGGWVYGYIDEYDKVTFEGEENDKGENE